MPYIIKQQTNSENCYFIRIGYGDIAVWGSKPRGAAEFATQEETQATIDRQLKSFNCVVLEIHK